MGKNKYNTHARLQDLKHERFSTELKGSAVVINSNSTAADWTYHGVNRGIHDADYDSDAPADFYDDEEGRDREGHPLDFRNLVQRQHKHREQRQRNPRTGLSLHWFVGLFLQEQYGLTGDVKQYSSKSRSHHHFTGELKIWHYLTFHRLQKTVIHVNLDGTIIRVEKRDSLYSRSGNKIDFSIVPPWEVSGKNITIDYANIDPTSVQDYKTYQRNKFYSHLEAAYKLASILGIHKNPGMTPAQKESSIERVNSNHYTREKLDRVVLDQLGKANQVERLRQQGKTEMVVPNESAGRKIGKKAIRRPA